MIHTNSGKYEFIDVDKIKHTIFLNKHQAKFMYNAMAQLGFYSMNPVVVIDPLPEYLKIKTSRGHNLSGKYKMIKQNGIEIIVHLTITQASFLFKAHHDLGFKEIHLIEKIHDTDIPEWARI